MMRTHSFVILLSIVLRIGCLNNSTFDLIMAFLNEHRLNSITFYICWRNSVSISGCKVLSISTEQEAILLSPFRRMQAARLISRFWLLSSFPMILILLQSAICCLSPERITIVEKVEIQKLISRSLLIRTRFQSERIWPVEHHNRAGYILDSSCRSYKNVLAESSERGLFRFTYSWLIIVGEPKASTDFDIKSLLDGIQLRADMDMKIAIFDSGNHYKIFELYKMGTGLDITTNRIGDSSNTTLHYFRNRSSFYESRKNLSGVLLKSGNTYNYLLETEEEVAKEYKNIDHPTFGKFQYIVFLNLKNTHNFCYNTTIRSVWYGNSSSGIDGGIAQLLHEKVLDISSAGGILRIGRMEYYDHLLPFFNFKACYFFKNPGTVKPGTEVLKPFSVNTWYAVSGSGLLMSAAILLAFYTEHRFFNSKTMYSFFTSVLITISIFSQQGSAILPTHLGCRLIVLNLLILSILLYNYFTSSLVSSLLSSKPTVLTTIKELYESNLKVGIEYQPFTISYIILQKKDEYIQKLNTSKIYEKGRPNFLSPDVGMAMVKKGGFAYHTTTDSAYSLVLRTFDQESICDLSEIDFVTPGIVGLTLQKRSQYTELFQISMVMMRTGGIMKREKEFWIPKKPKCMLSSRVLSVGVNELFLVYFLLFSGIILSLSILVMEIVWSRWNHPNGVSHTFIN